MFTLHCPVPAYIDADELVKHVRVVRSKVTVLRCPVQGIPSPNITWLKDGAPINPHEARIRLLMSGRHLELSLAAESDAAWYTCVADNVAGSAKMEFNLSVIGRYCLSVCHIQRTCHLLSDLEVTFNKTRQTHAIDK